MPILANHRPLLAGFAATTALLATFLPAPVAEATPPPPGASSVLRWNEVAARTALAACLSPGNDPLHESRMYAMASLAVHNALNAVHRRYRSYGPAISPDRRASADAAVAAAASTVLISTLNELPDGFVDCRPAGLTTIRDAYGAELGAIPVGPARDRGVTVGTAAARAIIAGRVGDGSDTLLVDAGYPQGTAPGQWRFTPDRPFAFAPGWAQVRPFALRGSRAFRVEPAYRLDSRKYARDFAEVKSLGGNGTTSPSARTPDQTEAARFWIESSPLQWNRIARTIAASRGLDPWTAARMFALLNMALADGYVASWAVKYAQPFWRPVTAIREAASDGNPATEADTGWTPLDTTPPIPDHDSAHAVQGAAAATVLAAVLGTDRVRFSSCSLTLPEGSQCDDTSPTLRRFTSLWQAAQENANSRVWVGYHFRHASEVGLDHGRVVAKLVMRDMLAPSREHRESRVSGGPGSRMLII